MRLRYLALANATRRYPLHLAQLARVASLQYTDPQAQMQAAQQAAAAAPAGAVAQAAQVEQQPLDARSVGDGAGAEDEEPTAHEVLQAAAGEKIDVGDFWATQGPVLKTSGFLGACAGRQGPRGSEGTRPTGLPEGC